MSSLCQLEEKLVSGKRCHEVLTDYQATHRLQARLQVDKNDGQAHP